VENKDKITIDEKKEETQSDSSEPRDELKSRVESSEGDSEATTLVTKPKPNYVEASGFRRRPRVQPGFKPPIGFDVQEGRRSRRA